MEATRKFAPVAINFGSVVGLFYSVIPSGATESDLERFGGELVASAEESRSLASLGMTIVPEWRLQKISRRNVSR